jgi:hypothetical protein
VYKRRGTILMVDAEAANVMNFLDGEDPRKRKKSMTSKRKPIPQFSNAPMQSSREHKISRGSNVSIMNSFKASRMASRMSHRELRRFEVVNKCKNKRRGELARTFLFLFRFFDSRPVLIL